MMKNFVKLLVIAMAPVVLTSGVQASKLVDKQNLLTDVMEQYWVNKYAAVFAAENYAKEIEKMFAGNITAKEAAAIDTTFKSLQGEKLSWGTWTWQLLPLTSTTDAKLKGNIAKIWTSFSYKPLQIKGVKSSEQKAPMTIKYVSVDWKPETGDAYAIIVETKDETKLPKFTGETGARTEQVVEKYNGLGRLIHIIANTYKKENYGANKPAPAYIIALIDQLANVDFYTPVHTYAAGLNAPAELTAFFNLDTQKKALETEIAELQKAEAAVPKYLATSLNILLKD